MRSIRAVSAVAVTTAGVVSLSSAAIAAVPGSEVTSHDADGSADDGVSADAAVAPDGSFVVYSAISTDLGPGNPFPTSQLYLYDTTTDTTKLIMATKFSELDDGDSVQPSVSPDSSYVVFQSSAKHLAPGGKIGLGLYVYEVATGRIKAVAAGTGRVEAANPVVSAGARFPATRPDTTTSISPT